MKEKLGNSIYVELKRKEGYERNVEESKVEMD